MTREEQLLETWLRETTPEPPREIDVADIAARVSRQAPRRWLPIVAAACVVALVAGLILGLRDSHHTNPGRPAPTPTVATSTPPSPKPTSPKPTSSKPTRPAPPAPWGAIRLGTGTFAGNSLQTIDGGLYAITFGRKQHIVRVDPGTGGILARSRPFSINPERETVAAGGAIWTAGWQRGETATLRGLDPATLSDRTSLAVRLGPSTELRVVLAVAGPDSLLVGGGDQVVLVDVHTRTELRRFTVDGPVSGLALSPDGSQLYVAIDSGGDSGRIEARDPVTGTLTATGPTDEFISALRATDGGVWYGEAGGHSAAIGFSRSEEIGARSNAVFPAGGGGFNVLPAISGAVAWLGAFGAVGCADPDTGRVRARVSFRERPGYLDGITILGGIAYALYGRNPASSPLVVLHPPPRCGVN